MRVLHQRDCQRVHDLWVPLRAELGEIVRRVVTLSPFLRVLKALNGRRDLETLGIANLALIDGDRGSLWALVPAVAQRRWQDRGPKNERCSAHAVGLRVGSSTKEPGNALQLS